MKVWCTPTHAGRKAPLWFTSFLSVRLLTHCHWGDVQPNLWGDPLQYAHCCTADMVQIPLCPSAVSPHPLFLPPPMLQRKEKKSFFFCKKLHLKALLLIDAIQAHLITFSSWAHFNICSQLCRLKKKYWHSNSNSMYLVCGDAVSCMDTI